MEIVSIHAEGGSKFAILKKICDLHEGTSFTNVERIASNRELIMHGGKSVNESDYSSHN